MLYNLITSFRVELVLVAVVVLVVAVVVVDRFLNNSAKITSMQFPLICIFG